MAAHTEDDDGDDDDEKEGPAHSDTSHGLGCQWTGSCPVSTMVKSRAAQVLVDASLVVTCVLVRCTRSCNTKSRFVNLKKQLNK